MRSYSEKEAGSAVLKEYSSFFKRQYLDYEAALITVGYTGTNKTFLPIQVVTDADEFVSIIDMVSSDNTLMTKVLGILSSLCVEVVELKKEAFTKHFAFLAVYEEYAQPDVSSYMDSVCLLNAFLTRCNEVLKNVCSQVFAIYTEALVNLDGIQLHYVINHIGELFTIIILLELLIINTSLSQNWNNYCKEVKHAPPNEFTEDEFKSLEGALDNITAKLMSDNIVQNSIKNLLVLREKNINKNFSTLCNEVNQYLRVGIGNLDKLVQEQPTSTNMYRSIKMNALYVLNSHLFGSTDKKIFKSLIELNSKAHSVPVAGTVMWYPEQFLQRYVAAMCSSFGKLPQIMLKSRQTYLSNKRASLARDVAALQAATTRWIVKVEEYFSPKHAQLNAAEMNLHTKVLLQGVDVVSETHHTLLTVINLHLSLGAPLSKTMLMSIFDIIDVLKGVRDAVTRNSSSVATSIGMITQHLMFQATSAVLEVKKSLMGDKNYANRRLDELTCLVVAERALRGAASPARLATAAVALALVPDSAYMDDSYPRLGLLLEKIDTLTHFVTSVHRYTDCSFILWHQNVIPIYFEQEFATQPKPQKLKFFTRMLEDCSVLLHATDKLYAADKSQQFVGTIKSIFNGTVIKAYGQQIETNLRLHIHSHLQLDAINPLVTDMPKRVLLIVDNFRLMRLYLSVVPSVEHYLSTMYYNLTTVVLSDWRTYGEMRQMAKFKFNLATVQDNLPTQTLEQGLDVLEIMRNIHIFVAKYLYNLNNQMFVEKSSNNKHLNSINIRHVANSIRAHGAGVMNTTVNFTYQFLKKKFFTFSQFLYDEHIKSRLIKDLRHFKEHSATNGGMYDYRNAEKFNKGIKTLGLAEDGQSYLDLFRDLISQIGNAMGYVRTVRSGGRHCCADATVFLPSLDEITSFKDLCEAESLSPITIEAAVNLDKNIEDLVCNFMHGTEYFRLLVDVFAPIFRNPKNVHLRNFFAIVPPLTLNFVEHMILAKDKMSKKNKVGAAFTDDGFAVGVAYILRLLDQDSSFESLHWFESVWAHVAAERQALEQQKRQGSAALQQTLALSERRLHTLEQEFQLLYYSLTSARIFFR